MMLRVLFVICFIFISPISYAKQKVIDTEQLHFRRLTTQDGLPSAYINTILQRKNGIMWIGTKGGLSRFDGQSMTNYHVVADDPRSLASDDIISLYEDSIQKLWIGTSKGLFLLNDKSNDFTSVPLLANEPAPLIFTIKQDAKHQYWIGTSHGVFVLNPQLEVVWQDLRDFSVKFIEQSSPDKMWIGTKTGLLLINPISKDHIPLPSQADTADIRLDEIRVYDGLIEDSTLWLATDRDGLLALNTNNNQLIKQYTSDHQWVTDSSIWSLAKQGDDLWLGYFYDGLSRFNTTTNENLSSNYHPQISYTIPYDNVSKVYFDNTGKLWVGTTNGLAISDPKNSVIRQIGEYQNITNKHVWSVAQHKDDVWFGTEDGLNRFNLTANTLSAYPSTRADNELPRTVIWSIYPQDDIVWLGTNMGLAKYHPSSNRFILFENNELLKQRINNQSVYSVTKHENYLVLGYYNGSIATFNVKTETFEDTFVGVAQGYVTNIIRQPESYVIASQNGLIELDITQAIEDTHTILLDNNKHITALKLINQRLWVATLHNGIYVFDKQDGQWNVIKQFNKNNGLPEDTVKSLSVANNNYIWATGRKSIYKIAPDTFHITRLSSSFHWLGMEFHDNASNSHPSDLVILAGNEGLVLFPAQQVVEQITFPKLTLSSLQVSNQRRYQQSQLTEIKINPGESFYSFNVSALEYLSPESIIYEYKLLPSDSDWQKLDGTKITLSNLPYGEYQLNLRATNSDQVFGQNNLVINLSVIPPFWWNSISKTTYLLLALIFILSIIRKHKKRLKRMTFKARHDALTGLPNRDYLINELEAKLASAKSSKDKVAVLFFDLNGFKAVNDTYGHDVGDKLLKHVALHISQCIREDDFFARQSGDEFILVLDKINQDHDLSKAIDRIQTAFNHAFVHENKVIDYGSSIGISVFDGKTPISAEELIKQADSAMYESKKQRQQFCFY